jgi:prepilin-type N-terminal cleavage/methylation domain-containing protein
MRNHTLRPVRGAFTLVELLVVLGIMLVLMALAVVIVSSGLIDNHRLSAGSDRVSGWLLQARSKAFRDRLPRGVRFIPDANGYVREAQFIEVPEPYVPNPDGNDQGFKLAYRYTEQDRVPGPGTYTAKEIFIIKNVGSTPAEMDVAFNEISAGDTLKISAFTTLHRIVNVERRYAPYAPPLSVYYNGSVQSFPALKIVLANDPFPATLPIQADTPKLTDLGGQYTAKSDANYLNPPFLYTTTGFAIIRQARPMLGEQPLKFSANTMIQIAQPVSNLPAAPTFRPGTTSESLISMSLIPAIDQGGTVTGNIQAFNYDVLFGATGEVQNNAGLGRVVLWMRNPDFIPTSFGVRNANTDDRAAFDRAGEMALITVYCKTGAVATHPVQLPVAGPTMSASHAYQFTKDGIASGL